MTNTGINILIVDDNLKNLQVLGAALKENGYSIEFAMNGKDALNWVTSKIFDLILLDIMMPEVDGFEVCKYLKKDPATKDIPIIFLRRHISASCCNKSFFIQ